jgi:hypothetical protein
MKTILQWSVYAYNMPDMSNYKPNDEVSVSVFAESEVEAIEKAAKIFKRQFYKPTHVHEMYDQEDLMKQSHGELPPRPWEK